MASPPPEPFRPLRLLQPSPDKPLPLWMIFPVVFVAVYLSHISLLRLPYYWDEAGYYIPAAHDFFVSHTLIPYSTPANAHPPLASLLLAAWWSIASFVPSATRTFMCLVTAVALLGVYVVARRLATPSVAAVTTLLTALYPVWFAQSTLAHGDMFAAAGSMWALAFYFKSLDRPESLRPLVLSAVLFSVAALAKETAILTALALAGYEIARPRETPQPGVTQRIMRAGLLLASALPLAAWYAYHRHLTGYALGDPSFVRYNATETLTPLRFVLAFAHRLFHATLHMNMFVPTICMIAAMFLPPRQEQTEPGLYFTRPAAKHRPVLLLVILTQLILFSLLGGALLTRYLLPVYPLVLLAAVTTWWRRVPYWGGLAAFSAVAFYLGLMVNPPYRFAQEDNLAYRDMIVLHQHAVTRLARSVAAPPVLTAWPASDELSKPLLGYTSAPVAVINEQDFTPESLQSFLASHVDAKSAFIFSTKYAPAQLPFNLGERNELWEETYFGYHKDLSAAQAAVVLHGKLVWYEERKGQWAAIIALPH